MDWPDLHELEVDFTKNTKNTSGDPQGINTNKRKGTRSTSKNTQSHTRFNNNMSKDTRVVHPNL